MFPTWANYHFREVGNTRLRERSEESPEPITAVDEYGFQGLLALQPKSGVPDFGKS